MTVTQKALRNVLLQGHVLEILKQLPDNYVSCAVTSPPYWGLRKYSGEQEIIWDGAVDCQHEWTDMLISHSKDSNPKTLEWLTGGNPGNKVLGEKVSQGRFCRKCGAWRGALGLEPTPELYIQHLVQVFQEVKRVLRKDGVCYVTIGDTYYYGSGTGQLKSKLAGKNLDAKETWGQMEACDAAINTRAKNHPVLKSKDRCLIPERLTIALQEDGWWIRDVIIYAKCLSGNTSIFAKSKNGYVRTTVRELYRLRKNDLYLPSLTGWVQIHDIKYVGKRQVRRIVFRDGYWVTTTPEHRFRTSTGLVETRKLTIGTVVDFKTISLENKESLLTSHQAGEFIGWFLAEGSYERDGVRFSLSVDEERVAKQLGAFADYVFSAPYRIHGYGTNLNLIIYSRAISGFVREFIDDKGAKKKHFARAAWNTNIEFLRGIIDGWLAGDASQDKSHLERWTLGFGYNLELDQDLRTACNIVGYRYRSHNSWAKYQNEKKLCIRGEVRKKLSNHQNLTVNTEIVDVFDLRNPQDCYDIELDSDDHLFLLPNGAVLHNSNPMPESCRDRRTDAYEEILMLTKSANYWYDGHAIKERRIYDFDKKPQYDEDSNPHDPIKKEAAVGRNARNFMLLSTEPFGYEMCNNKNCWRVYDSQEYGQLQELSYVDEVLLEIDEDHAEKKIRICLCDYGFWLSHFATFGRKLVEPLILSACPAWICQTCGKPRRRISEKIGEFQRRWSTTNAPSSPYKSQSSMQNLYAKFGWTRCDHKNYQPGIVLDPFAGTGTTLIAAHNLGRDYLGIEISEEYIHLAKERMKRELQKPLIPVVELKHQ